MRIATFIERQTIIEDNAGAPLPRVRAIYENLHAEHRYPDPAGMRVTDARIDGIAVRRFLPAACTAGTVVYLHGGGWNLGSVRSHHGITADLAERLGHEVVSVDYRLLPEASYAEALTDCREVVEALDPLAVIGDSAGGRLAIDVAYTSLWQGVLGLIYPVVGTPTLESLGEDAPLLSRADILSLWQTAAATVPDIPVARPPAACIEALAVERDPLTRPLERAVEAWRRNGASVGYRCAPNMVHAALHAHAELPEMQTAWRDFCQAVKRRLDEE